MTHPSHALKRMKALEVELALADLALVPLLTFPPGPRVLQRVRRCVHDIIVAEERRQEATRLRRIEHGVDLGLQLILRRALELVVHHRVDRLGL